jgi:hypothetical protein
MKIQKGKEKNDQPKRDESRKTGKVNVRTGCRAGGAMIIPR